MKIHIDKLIGDYFTIEDQIYKYFGYVEDWCRFPMDDSRECYWYIIKGETHKNEFCDGFGGYVRFSKTKEGLTDDSLCYENKIYTQRFLPKWVYEAEDYTMILVDTLADGNIYLQIFDNKKRVLDHER